MDCTRLRSALSEAASGAPLPAAASAHVAACAGCQDRLAEERALLARIDAALAASVAIEPSAGFRAGVRRRIADPAHGRRNAMGHWLAAAAAIVAALSLAVAQWTRDRAGARPATQLTRKAPAGAAPAAAPAAEPIVTHAERPRAARPARPRARPLPAVIVPPGEAAALEAYRHSLAGQVVVSLPAPRAELSVRALEIEPLGEPDHEGWRPGGSGEEGVR